MPRKFGSTNVLCSKICGMCYAPYPYLEMCYAIDPNLLMFCMPNLKLQMCGVLGPNPKMLCNKINGSKIVIAYNYIQKFVKSSGLPL